MEERELEQPDRADCHSCNGDGYARDTHGNVIVGSYLSPVDTCPDCLGTGKELTRDDYLALSAQDEQADGAKDLRLVQEVE